MQEYRHLYSASLACLQNVVCRPVITMKPQALHQGTLGNYQCRVRPFGTAICCFLVYTLLHGESTFVFDYSIANYFKMLWVTEVRFKRQQTTPGYGTSFTCVNWADSRAGLIGLEKSSYSCRCLQSRHYTEYDIQSTVLRDVFL